MYQVSDAFKAALLKSHTVVVKAELWTPTVKIQDLKLEKSDVTIDRTAKVRRTCSVTLSDEAMVPFDASAPMWPAGNEIRLFRGIRLATGDELAPLGVFRISKPQMDDNGVVSMKVSGYDRSKTVSRARFDKPYVVVAGTRYDTAIKTLIQSRVSWMTAAHFNFAPISTTTPLLVFDAQKDPWDCALEMAENVGCELYFDADGICVLTPVVDPASITTSATYIEGQNNTLVKTSRSIDDENAYNGFIVNGESSANAAPIYSEKWDDDPASPTYYLGPYGKMPMFYTSNMITTQAQADAYALSMYYKNKGFAELVEFSAIPHAALDAGDVVQVTRLRSGINITGTVESIKISQDINSDMSVSMRRRNIAV